MQRASDLRLPAVLLCPTLADTVAAGRSVARALLRDRADGTPAVIALMGPLGAGKTTFVKGIGLELGVGETITSPSFALVAEYPTTSGEDCRIALTHVDLYRIETASGVESLALDDMLRDTRFMVVEWADRAREVLPRFSLSVEIAIVPPSSRRLTFNPS